MKEEGEKEKQDRKCPSLTRYLPEAQAYPMFLR